MKGKYSKLFKRRHETKVSVRLALLLAAVGGFLDAYTYICRGEVFANAQTGNIVLLGISIAQGEYFKVLLYLLPITAFCLGVIVSHILKQSKTEVAECVILIFEIFIFIILMSLGNKINDTIATISASFIASVQVSSFRKLIEYPYCSTMCTGNLRNASDALYSAVKYKDIKMLKKSILYFVIIFAFILGATIGSFASNSYSHHSLIIPILILTISLLLFLFENRSKNANTN